MILESRGSDRKLQLVRNEATC